MTAAPTCLSLNILVNSIEGLKSARDTRLLTLTPTEGPKVEQQVRHYYQRRALTEQTAAMAATCPEAMRVHQQLAELYAELVQQPEVPAPASEEGAGRQKIVFLSRD